MSGVVPTRQMDPKSASLCLCYATSGNMLLVADEAAAAHLGVARHSLQAGLADCPRCAEGAVQALAHPSQR